MAEEENMESPASPDAVPSTPSRERPYRKALTPEQRRLLGTPRSLQNRADARPPPRSFKEESTGAEPPDRKRKRSSHATAILPGQKSSRVLEMQNAFVIIGAIFLICLTFYVGKKFDYWRYLIASRHKPELSNIGSANQFPNISSDDLIEQALTAERSGKWEEAAQKLIAAKYKNLTYRGILIRVAKIAYDHGDLDNADKVFDHAIAFGENLDLANYYRALIAVQRRNFPAAERFFEAAANVEPFNPQYYYFWAEAFRMDHHPREAIPHYAQAEQRAHNEQEETACRFKQRIARLEAGQGAEVKLEIEKNRNQGSLSVDWLMTDAALKIHEGKIPKALQLISAAQNVNQPDLFMACAADLLFHDAGKKHPELAEACRAKNVSQLTSP